MVVWVVRGLARNGTGGFGGGNEGCGGVYSEEVWSLAMVNDGVAALELRL